MPTQRKKSWKLSVLLAKKHVSTRDECVQKKPRVLEQSVKLPNGSKATLYFTRSHPTEPSWVSFFDGLIDASRLRTSSVSAALVLKHKQRWFALTFGHGRYLLDLNAFEDNFGLKVSLNAIDPDSLRSIDRATIDAQGRHGREQSSRPSSINDFGLDIERDILRSVTGRPLRAEFGNSMSGRDALMIHPCVNVQGIAGLLDMALTEYRRRKYKKDYPWIDQIQEVRDGETIDSLNSDLIDRLKDQDLDKLWMAVPEVVEWEHLSGFKYSLSERSSTYTDVVLSDFLQSLRTLNTLSIPRLKNRRVYGVDDSTTAPRYAWPAFRCMYCETEKGDDVFLLNNGKWYVVARSFTQTVNRSIAQIRQAPRLRLPVCGDETETEYNARVANSHPRRFALMDCKNIPFGGGASKIEFCDLYESRRLIHVKKYGGSSVLSHLFQQGLVSAALFRAEPAFRKLVNAKLPRSHKLTDTTRNPRAQDYEIAFAIGILRLLKLLANPVEDWLPKLVDPTASPHDYLPCPEQARTSILPTSASSRRTNLATTRLPVVAFIFYSLRARRLDARFNRSRSASVMRFLSTHLPTPRHR